jgi:hypothetical protein
MPFRHRQSVKVADSGCPFSLALRCLQQKHRDYAALDAICTKNRTDGSVRHAYFVLGYKRCFLPRKIGQRGRARAGGFLQFFSKASARSTVNVTFDAVDMRPACFGQSRWSSTTKNT